MTFFCIRIHKCQVVEILHCHRNSIMFLKKRREKCLAGTRMCHSSLHTLFKRRHRARYVHHRLRRFEGRPANVALSLRVASSGNEIWASTGGRSWPSRLGANTWVGGGESWMDSSNAELSQLGTFHLLNRSKSARTQWQVSVSHTPGH